jgi:hypothetical protein
VTVTATDVAGWSGVQMHELTTVEQDRLEATLAAVTAHVEHHCLPALELARGADFDQAVIMQTARLWKRRGSPEGVAGFGDLGTVYVTRLDHDVARLLEPYKDRGSP